MKLQVLYLFCVVNVAIAFKLPNGKSNVGLTNPFKKIPATTWDHVEGGVRVFNCTDQSACTQYAGLLNAKGIIGYYDVDFKGGARGLHILVAMDDGVDHIGKIRFHLDDAHAQPFAVVVTGDTGTNEAWTEVKQFIEYVPTGLHDLYLTFASDYAGNVGNINSFTFVESLEH